MLAVTTGKPVFANSSAASRFWLALPMTMAVKGPLINCKEAPMVTVVPKNTNNMAKP
jgi:hypothetical protein